MTTYDRSAKKLDVNFVARDGFYLQFIVDVDLTGYTFEAKVTRKNTDVGTIAVDCAAGASSIVTLTLDAASIEALDLTAEYEWFFQWTNGGVKRTLFAGDFSPKDT